MSSNPAEPEKYSLDEMLERLQSKPSAEPENSGELVTRADGSQAIKVRRRKRRSTQPHKEAAKRAFRLKAIQVSSLVVFILLLALTFGVLIVYTNSAPYRNKLLAKFNEATGAETVFQQMRVTPTASRVADIEFTWPTGNIAKKLSLSDARAQALLGGVIGNRWSVSEISVAKGNFHIGTPEPGQPTRFSPKPTGSSPISFGRLAVNKLNLTVGSPDDPAIRLFDTEATLYTTEAAETPTVRLFRGQAQVRDWPLFRIDRALLEAKGPEIEIVTLRLLHELDNNGSLELSGKFDPAAISSQQQLGVKMTSFNLNGIAGNSLGHLISGRVDSAGSEGKNRLEFSSQSGGKLTVSFTGAPNTLPKANNFTFLGKLSKITENPWFIDPTFRDSFSGTLHRDAKSVSMTGLNLLSRSHLWITGDLSVSSNDVLTGTLNVGLPELVVSSSRNKELAAAFAENRDGFRWITLKIGGTGSRPSDNFDEMAGKAASSAAQSEGDMFDRLTTPKGK